MIDTIPHQSECPTDVDVIVRRVTGRSPTAPRTARCMDRRGGISVATLLQRERDHAWKWGDAIMMARFDQALDTLEAAS